MSESFKDVINGPIPVLVDFYAEWCGPCKMMAPVLKQLRDKWPERIRILKIDVDKNTAVAQAFGIQGVPTLILFKQGNIAWRQSGAMNLSQLENSLNAALDS